MKHVRLFQVNFDVQANNGKVQESNMYTNKMKTRNS